MNKQKTTLEKYNFDELYRQHAPKVQKLCLGYSGDSDVANDLVQEVFISVWQHLDSFRGASKISTWIYRITVNTCLGYLRSEKKKPAQVTDRLLETVADAITQDPRIQQLYAAIATLKEADRILITMVLEDISYEEIAIALEVSEATLRVRIHRIKKQLTEIFEKNGQF